MKTERLVRLVATARQMYGGRLLVPGDEFSACESDASDMCAVGFARRVAIVVQATQQVEAEELLSAQPRKRRYHRRDMSAQE